MKNRWPAAIFVASAFIGILTYSRYTRKSQDTETPALTTLVPIQPKAHTNILYLSQFSSTELRHDIQRIDGQAIHHDWRFSPLHTARFAGRTLLYFYHDTAKGNFEATIVPGYQKGEPYKNEDGAEVVLVDVIPKEDYEKLQHQMNGKVHGNIFFWP
jgi:hypothetical protein